MFLQLFIVPAGIMWLPSLVILRWMYIRLLSCMIELMWMSMCRIYVFLVDAYVAVAVGRKTRRR